MRRTCGKATTVALQERNDALKQEKIVAKASFWECHFWSSNDPQRQVAILNRVRG